MDEAGPLNLLWEYRVEVLACWFALVATEAAFVLWRSGRVADWRETVANGVIFGVGHGSRRLSYAFRFAVFAALYAWSPLRAPTSWQTLVFCFVAVDFLFYWKHRLLHETELGWAFHAVHHSSRELNLTTAVRSSWVQRLFDDFFFLPLALLGVDPFVLMIVIDLNLATQYWVHTEAVGRLGLLDRFVNTPSNHRVHHSVNAQESRHNFGSTLMVWDRLFGTYRAEGPVTRFGTEYGLLGHNVLRIQFLPFLLYLKRRRAAAHSRSRIAAR